MANIKNMAEIANSEGPDGENGVIYQSYFALIKFADN